MNIELTTTIILGLLAVTLKRQYALAILIFTNFLGYLVFGFDTTTLIGFALVLRYFKGFVSEIFSNPILRYFLVFVIFALLSGLWVESFFFWDFAIRRLIRLFLLSGVVLALLRNKKDLNYVFSGLVVGLTYVVIILLLNQLGYNTIVSFNNTTQRLQYGILGTNALGFMVTWSITYVYYFSKSRFKKNKLLKNFILYGLYPSLFFVNMLTGSRSSIIVYILAFLIVQFNFGTRRTNVGLLFILFPIIYVLLNVGVEPIVRNTIYPFASSNLKLRLEYTLAGYDDTQRISIMKTGLLMFADNPILGVGAGNAQQAFEEYYWEGGYIQYYGSLHRSLHNEFITALAEYGVIGSAFYFLFLIRTLGIGLRGKNKHINLSLALLLCMVGTGMTHVFSGVTLIILILVSSYRLFQYDAEKIPSESVPATPPNRIPVKALT
ncbi:O-antigen ligase family protein [bacterium]|nr:O-antigen ligase family protein [bacterium]